MNIIYCTNAYSSSTGRRKKRLFPKKISEQAVCWDNCKCKSLFLVHCNNVVPSSPYKANCLLWAGYVTLIGSAVTQLRASLYGAQKTDISENAVVHIKSIVM